MNNKIKVRLISSFVGLLFMACQTTMPASPEENTLLDGHIEGLSNEVKQKLTDYKPETLARASRIPGVTPAAISLLLIYLKKNGILNKNRKIA